MLVQFADDGDDNVDTGEVVMRHMKSPPEDDFQLPDVEVSGKWLNANH